MATIDLDVSGVLASTGWTGATVANLSTQNDVRATDGQKNEVIRCDLDNVPGDFGSMNNVTLHIEGRRGGTGARTLSFTVALLNSALTTLESFTTANLGTSDVQYDSSAFTRTDSSSTINGWQLQVTVNEGGGMPGGDDTSQVDRMWVTLDYNVASTDTWDQDSFRVYNDGTESGAVAKRAVNTNWTQRTNTRFHIRFLIQETGGGADTMTLQLQYNKGGAGWNDVTGASSNVRMEASALTEGGDTTQRIGAGTFLSNNNWQDDNDGLTAASASFAGNDEAEAVFSCYVVDADVADGNTIQLRVVESPSTALDTYTNTPTLTVQKGNEELSDSLTLTESQVRTGVWDRLMAEGLTLVDTLTRPSVFDRILSDSTPLTEGALIRTGVWDRALSDGLTLTEALSRDLVVTRAMADTLTLTDSILHRIQPEVVAWFFRPRRM